MKRSRSLFAALLRTVVALARPASTDSQQPSDEARAEPAQDEATGRHDLTKINRPATEVSSLVEIDARSNIATRYQINLTPDILLRPHQGNLPITRALGHLHHLLLTHPAGIAALLTDSNASLHGSFHRSLRF